MKEAASRTPQQDAINITLCAAMAVCSVHMLRASFDFVVGVILLVGVWTSIHSVNHGDWSLLVGRFAVEIVELSLDLDHYSRTICLFFLSDYSTNLAFIANKFGLDKIYEAQKRMRCYLHAIL